MALTISQVGLDTVFGNKRIRVLDLTFDSSYLTGGESLTAADCRLNTIDLVLCSQAGGRTFEYDYTNSTLKSYSPVTAHTHTENTAASYAQNATTAAATAGPGAQVASAVDLSAVTVRAIVVGV